MVFICSTSGRKRVERKGDKTCSKVPETGIKPWTAASSSDDPVWGDSSTSKPLAASTHVFSNDCFQKEKKNIPVRMSAHCIMRSPTTGDPKALS